MWSEKEQSSNVNRCDFNSVMSKNLSTEVLFSNVSSCLNRLQPLHPSVLTPTFSGIVDWSSCGRKCYLADGI